MFNELYKLYGKRNSNRKPLEDFNTECFAGVLRMSPVVLKSFIKFLELPEGTYKVITQAPYSLEGHNNCIIDMVLESNTDICFIENKVNSIEGPDQLDRYALALDKYYKNDERQIQKQTYLRYCTKKVDLKHREEHKFFQFRWFQIGKLLADIHTSNILANNTTSKALVANYLHFLQKNNMAIDPSISTDTVVTLKNYKKTNAAMIYHVEESVKNFKKAFPNARMNQPNESKKREDFRNNSRHANSILNPFEDTSAPAEILYSVEFNNVRLQTQIWVNAGHKQIDKIYEKAKKLDLFEFPEMNEHGLGLRNRKPLYSFIDSPNSDEEIKQWFKESFEKIRAFIDMTPELGWSESLKKVEKK